jgi:hypothetical protein
MSEHPGKPTDDERDAAAEQFYERDDRDYAAIVLLETILDGFDKGIFVRGVEHDDKPNWALRVAPFMLALAKAQVLLQPERAQSNEVSPARYWKRIIPAAGDPVVPVSASSLIERAEQQRMVARAREAVATFRDAAREGREIGFRQRDPLVVAIHRALDLVDPLLVRVQALEQEVEKFRTAARVLCGAHIGVPQPSCPVCRVEQLTQAQGFVPASTGGQPIEIQQLFADHSVALEFVREIAGLEDCPIDCGNCIVCRARYWLHAERALPSPPAEPQP